MVIINTIIAEVGKGKIDKAILLFQKFANSPNLVDLSTILLARYSQTKNEYQKGTLTYEEFDKYKNIINENLLDLIKSLPADFEIFKSKVLTIINDYGVLTEALELLSYVVSKQIYFRLEKIQNDFSNEQEQIGNNSTTEIDDDTWDSINIKFSEKIVSFVKELNLYHLDGNWENDFFEYINSSRDYFAKHSATENSENSLDYYPDINSISSKSPEFKVKGSLFHWLELFIITDYKNALEILNNIRNSNGIATSRFYEYMMITYLHEIGFDKFVRNCVISGKSAEQKRILFFIERIKDDENCGRSRWNTLNKCIIEILIQLNRIHQNIAHNHLTDPIPRGRSAKRNIIKRCFDFLIHLATKLEEVKQLEIDSSVVVEFIVELEGGGKYEWININKDTLSNTTTYDALNARTKLFDFLDKIDSKKREESVNLSLISSLRQTGGELQKSSDIDDVKKRKFINVCILGYYFHKDQEYIELIKRMNRGIKIERKPLYKEINKKKIEIELSLPLNLKPIEEESDLLRERGGVDSSVGVVAISTSKIIANLNTEHDYSFNEFMDSIGEAIGNEFTDSPVIKSIISISEIIENLNSESKEEKSPQLEADVKKEERFVVEPSLIKMIVIISKLTFSYGEVSNYESNKEQLKKAIKNDINYTGVKAPVLDLNKRDHLAKVIVFIVYLALIILMIISLNKAYFLIVEYLTYIFIITFVALWISKIVDL